MFWSSIVLCAITIYNAPQDILSTSESFLGISLTVFTILAVGVMFRFLSMRQPYRNAPTPVVKSKVFLYTGWLFYFSAGIFLCSFLPGAAILAITGLLLDSDLVELSAFAKELDFATISSFAIALILGNFFYKRALDPPFWTLGTTITMFFQGFQRNRSNITPPSH